MSRKSKNHMYGGFSMIELLIAVSIIGVLTLLGVKHHKQSETDNAYNEVAVASGRVSLDLQAIIGRDITYGDASGGSPVTLPYWGEADITRTAIVPQNSNEAPGTFIVKYKNNCGPASPLAIKYGNLMTLYQQPLMQASTGCLQKTTCSLGQVPYVTVDANSSGIGGSGLGVKPNYAVTSFPADPTKSVINSKNTATIPLGTAVCFRTGTGPNPEVKVTVQTVYGKGIPVLGLPNIGVATKEAVYAMPSSAYTIIQQK